MVETRKKKAGASRKAAGRPSAKAAAQKAEKQARETSRPAAPAPPPARPHARLRFLRVTPRKVRLVADHLRGMKVGDALSLLRYTPQAAAKPLAKLLRSAVANAEQKGGRVDVDALYVRALTVDQGPKFRRYMPRAMGRATRIDKKTSHVYVELGTGSGA